MLPPLPIKAFNVLFTVTLNSPPEGPSTCVISDSSSDDRSVSWELLLFHLLSHLLKGEHLSFLMEKDSRDWAPLLLALCLS